MGLPTNSKNGKAEPSAILSDLTLHHQVQLDLCDDLEKIADQLPDRVDPQNCLRVAQAIYPTVKKAHTYEENQLFPFLTAHYEQYVMPQTIDRLHSEHWEDESFACEVQEALVSFVTTPQWANTEALGYMLRGFFEGLRRHIAFERELLGTLITSRTALN